MSLFGNEFDICPHCGYAVGTHAEEAIHMEPETLLHNRYIIGKVLGFGGFGITYIAWDKKLEQKVAVKEFLPGEFSTRMPGQTMITVFNGDKSEQFKDGMKKFVDEAKRLARFQNETGIVKVFDSFEENSTAYIIMEYLEGETLTEFLKKKGTLSADEAVEMLMPVMNSLQTVHESGLLHRDIAPDNIFITKNNEVKLIDFGASRHATTSHSRSLTVIIKPGYSPEEQYRSRGDQGKYTDVYALAATLYKMITGKTPPDAMERRAKYENKNKDILIKPHKLCKKIPVNKEVALLNALNVRIEDRTENIEEFIKELNADPPAKRKYGKIKKIDLYLWPTWLKILIPSLLGIITVFSVLMFSGIIKFSNYSEEIVVPDNIVIVPDVEGIQSTEALRLIEKAHLLALTEGTVQSEYIEAGKIVLQDPVGGSYLETNEAVFLTVSSGKEVQSAVNGVSVVPFVIWDTKEEAFEKIEKAGLGIPEIEEANNDNVAAGRVISQSIDYGTEVKEGTVIKLVISLGPPPFELPKIEGLKLEEAKQLLTSLGLSIKIEYAKDDNVEKGIVISHNIPVGITVKRGDTITIVISSGKDTVTVPNVSGKSSEEAVSILKEQGFNVRVLENYDFDIPAGKVISQNPNADSSQLKDTEIVIIVSKGAPPVSVVYSAVPDKPAPPASNTTTKPDPDKPASSVMLSVIFYVNIDSTLKAFSDTFEYMKPYGTLPEPSSVSGYEFTGWYTAQSGGTRITSETIVENPNAHMLYAHFSKKSYTITLDYGYNSKTSTKKIYYGDSVDLPVPERTDYIFDGWYNSSGLYIPIAKKYTFDSDQTFYARWMSETYTVTYFAYDRNYSYATITYNDRYTLPSPEPVRDYYNFEGWIDENGTRITEDSYFLLRRNQTLYAQWSEKPLSEWTEEKDVPANSKIVNRKWKYFKSIRSSEWVESSRGTNIYASFPDGFDKTNILYSYYNGENYTYYEEKNRKRVVSDTVLHTYIYWHWNYVIGGSVPLNNRYVNDYYTSYYSHFSAFEDPYEYGHQDSTGAIDNSVYFCNTGNSDDVSWWWYKTPVYKQEYVNYLLEEKIDVKEMESTTLIKEGGDISNVKQYVQYIPK